MRPIQSLGWSLCAFLALQGAPMAAPMTAAAQSDAEQSQAVDDGRYQELLAEALSEYEAGRYREARTLFDRAHEELPNARTLRGIGMASFELREYVDCVRFLRRALVHPVRPLTDDQRLSVEALRDRAAAFVGRYVVTTGPRGAALALDGAPPILEEDGSVLVDLGRHHFEVTCAGCRPASRVVEVRGGEDQAIELTALSESSSGVGATSGAQADRGADADAGSALGIVLVAGGGVLAGATAGAAVWWVGRNDEVARCEAAGAACHNLDALSGEQAAAAGVTIGLAAISVAALAVGMVLIFSGDDDTADAASLACAPTFGGMACAGTF